MFKKKKKQFNVRKTQYYLTVKRDDDSALS